MKFKTSESTSSSSYEIIFKKSGESLFSVYCPQLNLIIKGESEEELKQQMDRRITTHISQIKSKSD